MFTAILGTIPKFDFSLESLDQNKHLVTDNKTVNEIQAQ